MPPKRKRQSLSISSLIAPAPPVSDYKNFLSGLINKPPAKLKPSAINKWQDVPATPQGQIVNDIARKFNNGAPPLGINQLVYTRAAGQPNYYEGSTQTGKTRMTLAPPPSGKVGLGPNSVTVGHELMHANDHQIDKFNPKVWQNIGTLAATGGNPSPSGTLTPIKDFGNLQNSLKNIQDKIDLTGAFSPQYPIDQAYIEKEIQGASGSPYKTPFIGRGKKSSPNWSQLFTDINTQATTTSVPGGVPNPGFYINRASEYPAFMSENLTRPWGLNNAPNPLSRPEARFVHSTLGNMDTAYPGTDYPAMNHYIRERRNSIERAYEPANATYTAPHTPSAQAAGLPAPSLGLPPTATFFRGGLAKAIKKKRSKFFDHFKN